VVLAVFLIGILYRTRTPATPSAQSAAPAAKERTAFGFGIQAARHDNRLEIRWDPAVRSIEGVQTGVLKVTDAEQVIAIPLSSADLAAGRIMYVPRSESLGLELSVVTPAGPLSETVRVLLPRGQPPAVEVTRRPVNPTPQREPDTQTSTEAAAPPRQQPVFQAPTPAISSLRTATRLTPELSTPPALPRQEVTVAQTPIPRQSLTPSIGPPAEPDRTASPAAAKPASQAAEGPSEARATAVRNLVMTPPVPVRQVSPILPDVLRRTVYRPLVVEVTVYVDAEGAVTSAYTSKYSGLAGHLASFAVAAAKSWRFRPALRDGQPVPGNYMIRFSFDRTR
jgi:protein TonB